MSMGGIGVNLFILFISLFDTNLILESFLDGIFTRNMLVCMLNDFG